MQFELGCRTCAGLHKDADIFVRVVILFILLTCSVNTYHGIIVCVPSSARDDENTKRSKTRILTTKIIQSPWGKDSDRQL